MAQTMTFYICFGRYAGFRLMRDRGLRLTLGWVSLAWLAFDMEVEMQRVADFLGKLDGAILATGERVSVAAPVEAER